MENKGFNNNQSQVNYVIDLIKQKFKENPHKDSLHLNELRQDQLDLDKIGIPLIIDTLKQNSKFHYDEVKKMISKKNKYHIFNREDLIHFFKESKGVVEEDEDLFDCYNNLKEDLNKLKQQNKVRYFESKNPSKKTVIYAKDQELDNINYDEIVPQFFRDEYTKCIRENEEIFKHDQYYDDMESANFKKYKFSHKTGPKIKNFVTQIIYF